jgi:hypothetical protein
VVQHGKEFVMFFAGNNYGTSRYAAGEARATSPMGNLQPDGTYTPFTVKAEPMMQSASGALQGPGRVAPFSIDGKQEMVVSGWMPGHVGQSPGRVDAVVPLHWGANGWAYVTHGDAPLGSQPLPR